VQRTWPLSKANGFILAGHAHGRERKSGMGVTFLLSHCRKGVEWCVNRREIVGLVGIAERD
jgi:hypothetical protein